MTYTQIKFIHLFSEKIERPLTIPNEMRRDGLRVVTGNILLAALAISHGGFRLSGLGAVGRRNRGYNSL